MLEVAWVGWGVQPQFVQRNPSCNETIHRSRHQAHIAGNLEMYEFGSSCRWMRLGTVVLTNMWGRSVWSSTQIDNKYEPCTRIGQRGLHASFVCLFAPSWDGWSSLGRHFEGLGLNSGGLGTSFRRPRFSFRGPWTSYWKPWDISSLQAVFLAGPLFGRRHAPSPHSQAKAAGKCGNESVHWNYCPLENPWKIVKRARRRRWLNFAGLRALILHWATYKALDVVNDAFLKLHLLNRCRPCTAVVVASAGCVLDMLIFPATSLDHLAS